jgi:hypothetical protein
LFSRPMRASSRNKSLFSDIFRTYPGSRTLELSSNSRSRLQPIPYWGERSARFFGTRPDHNSPVKTIQCQRPHIFSRCYPRLATLRHWRVCDHAGHCLEAVLRSRKASSSHDSSRSAHRGQVSGYSSADGPQATRASGEIYENNLGDVGRPGFSPNRSINPGADGFAGEKHAPRRPRRGGASVCWLLYIDLGREFACNAGGLQKAVLSNRRPPERKCADAFCNRASEWRARYRIVTGAPLLPGNPAMPLWSERILLAMLEGYHWPAKIQYI